MIWSLSLLITVIPVQSKAFSINDAEKQILSEVSQILNIRHSIFLDESRQFFNNFKKLRLMPTAIMTEMKFFQHCFLDKSCFYVKTAVVIKSKNLENVPSLFQKIEKVNAKYLSKLTWLIFVDTFERNDVKNNQFTIPYDCQFLVIYQAGQGGYKLNEIYQIKNHTFVGEFGDWKKGFSFNASKISFYERRSNFQNATLIFATELDSVSVCPKSRMLRCAQREMFYEIQKMLNFRSVNMKLKRFEKSSVVDVYDSINYFHFYFYQYDTLAPLFKATVNWYIKDPTLQEQRDYYIRPFALDLWITILTAIFVGSSVNLIIQHMHHHFTQKLHYCFTDNIFTVFEAFCNQDGSQEKDNCIRKIVSMSFRLAALFVIPGYSATLTAFLAIRTPQIPFRDLEEFLKNGEYFVISDIGRFPYEFFNRTADPIAHKIKEKYLKAFPNDVGLEKTCEGKYAFVAPNNMVHLMEPKCKLFRIETPITFTFIGMGLQDDSPFRSIFNKKLVRLYSSGIQSRLQKITNSASFESKENKFFYAVGTNQITEVFTIFFVLISVTFLILFCEIIIKHKAWRLLS